MQDIILANEDRADTSAVTEKLKRRANNFLQTLSLLAGILFPVFGVLDYILFPDKALDLVLIRLLVLPVILGVFIYTFRARSYRHVEISGIVLYQSMALAIDFMVFLTGGVESRYYSGVNLVLLAMFLYMPWRPIYSVLNGLAIYLLYAAGLFVYHGGLPEYRLLISNSYFLLATIFLGSIWAYIGYNVLERETLANQTVSLEKERADGLLHNILPFRIARQLKETQSVKPELYPSASVLFSDFVGFTAIAGKMSPEDLLRDLDRYFQEFDRIIALHKLEKMKTIGDSYMCAGGLPIPRKTHALDCVAAGLEILKANRALAKEKEAAGLPFWKIRIGVHTGPVVAGITGTRKFAYDIWGDAVNTASRAESAAEEDSVNITAATHECVSEFFECVPRGSLEVKGKGLVEMYRVEGLRPEFQNEAGDGPNPEYYRRFRSYLVYGK